LQCDKKTTARQSNDVHKAYLCRHHMSRQMRK
jgi:hypothetical protein